jgi:hypothetical protein
LALLSAGSASLLLNLEAVFTMGIAILVGREHVSRKGAIAAALIFAGAVIIGGGTTTGATIHGAVLIALACLGWGIDNNISQRLSIRDPMQITLLKSVGASVPMLLGAGLTGAKFPTPMEAGILLVIGAIGYGLSIWLDLLALRELGAARESVIFATAPFVGAGFAVLALKEALSTNLIASGVLMVGGVALLLNEDHAHWHRYDEMWHEHKHLHAPGDQDAHHAHQHPNGEAENGKQMAPTGIPMSAMGTIGINIELFGIEATPAFSAPLSLGDSQQIGFFLLEIIPYRLLNHRNHCFSL